MSNSAQKRFLALGMLIAAMTLVGCRTTGKRLAWYEGPPRRTNETSLLKVQRDFPWGRSVLVWTIDGARVAEKYTFNNIREIELSPGTHTLGVMYLAAGTVPPTNNIPITFTCQAGRVYELCAAPVKESFGSDMKKATFGGAFWVTFWIVDVQSNETVAGDRRKEPIRWYEP
jgi:hypothetical protein